MRGAAPGTPAEMFTSYFGRWSLLPAESSVIHQQDGNLNPAQVGQPAKRGYSFDAAGHLYLTTPPRKRDDGHEVISVIIWERVH